MSRKEPVILYPFRCILTNQKLTTQQKRYKMERNNMALLCEFLVFLNLISVILNIINVILWIKRIIDSKKYIDNDDICDRKKLDKKTHQKTSDGFISNTNTKPG